MVMTREEKVALAADIKERIERASAMVLLDFGGVTVAQIDDLRTRFREAGVEYKVVKNNMVLKALEGNELADNDGFRSSLKGMTGIAWTFEDAAAAAKIVKKFRAEDKENEVLGIKGGVLEGEFLDAAAVENTLANLPGKDEVRAMLLAQLMAPAQNLVRQLNAPATNLALVLDAKRRKEEGEA